MDASENKSDWKAIPFESLDGWQTDDHASALACFRMSAKGFENQSNVTRSGIVQSGDLLKIARLALALDPTSTSALKARKFFEEHFVPMRRNEPSGFVTAYYEPEVEASREKTPEYPYPLYAKPSDLERLPADYRQDGLDTSLEWARKTKNGYEEFFDRGEIDNGALLGRELELFWVRSAVEGFYIHIQGSARLLLSDGTSVRVSYAGKTGHAYTSIGKLLVKRGIMSVEDANMVNMRKWLTSDKERGIKLLHENRSFIFFAELKGHDPDFGPIAAAGVQLTPGRSLAVDKQEHAYGTPVWVSTHDPLPSQTKQFQRLMIAQDTGSAIVGPERGDIFIGSGFEAGVLAGSVRNDTDFIVLKPRV